MVSIADLKIISCFFNKGQHIDIYRDKYGKFYARNNGVFTQKRLNAKEVVCYLSHVANDR